MLLKSSSEETAGKIIRWATIIAVILIGQKRLFQKTVMACFVNEAMEGIVDFDHLLDIAFFSVKLHMLEDGGDILNSLKSDFAETFGECHEITYDDFKARPWHQKLLALLSKIAAVML